jgi:hypothetical protein
MGNSQANWTLNLFEEYKKYFCAENWSSLSYCKLPWSMDLIVKYKDKWNFKGLSENVNLPWTDDIIEKYVDYWDWKELSANESIPFSVELISKYQEKWDWINLSSNKSIPWSIDLIEKFENKWLWTGDFENLDPPYELHINDEFPKIGLSSNVKIPFTKEFLQKYEDKWGWSSLLFNEGILWSKELIELITKDKKPYIFTSNSLNEFLLGNLNDNVLEKIMSKIRVFKEALFEKVEVLDRSKKQ